MAGRSQVSDLPEVVRLRRFVQDIKTALRPYNGTCEMDMEGRTQGEALAEVIEVVQALEAEGT
jgi:hypothetical protein